MLFLSWLDILKQAHINYLCSQTFIDINWMFFSVVVVQAHVAEHTLCGNQMKHRDRTTHNIMHPTSLISLLIICIQDPRRRTNILQRGHVHVVTNLTKTSNWQILEPPLSLGNVRYFLPENENHDWHIYKRKLKFEEGTWLPLYSKH